MPASERSIYRVDGIAWIVLAGTLVRGIFGWYTSTWNCAIDELAWGTGLDALVSGGWTTYKLWIHYPHEGGSLILSLVSLIFRPLSAIMPPLSWASLVVDALARYVQIRVAYRVFGKGTGAWFAGWTVLAAPVMVPWATVDCGLHALISFAPFVLLLLASEERIAFWKQGVLCGLLAAFSYEVWTCAPAIVAWILLRGPERSDRLRQVGMFCIGCAVGFLPHALLRLFADSGFGLEHLSPLSVRGLEQDPFRPIDLPQRLWNVLHSDLPASFALAAVDTWRPRLVSLAVLLFVVLGTFGAIRSRKPVVLLAFGMVLCFLLAVAGGPFFVHNDHGHGYLYHRYFPFIVPLLVLVMIEGFAALPRIALMRAAWCTGCGALSIAYMVHADRCETVDARAVGWVLARKYGDDPGMLMDLLERRPAQERQDLVFGAGWGFAAALFDRRTAEDTFAMERFGVLWDRFPASDRARLAEGVRQAFAPGITPALDDNVEPQVFSRLDRSRGK